MYSIEYIVEEDNMKFLEKVKIEVKFESLPI